MTDLVRFRWLLLPTIVAVLVLAYGNVEIRSSASR